MTTHAIKLAVEALEKLPAKDAPCYFDADEANSWSCGYSKGIEDCIKALHSLQSVTPSDVLSAADEMAKEMKRISELSDRSSADLIAVVALQNWRKARGEK